MSLRQPHEEAILSSEEIAMVRQVLVDCSLLLTTAQDLAGVPLAEATRAATAAKRSPGGMLYYLNLAIDYLDFAPASRRRR
jgi:hypothetical protein